MASLLFWTFLLGSLCLVSSREKRYISYTINMGEGFNLRRDVHMRVANLVRSLRINTEYDWVLVLPPWPRLYHWKSSVPQSWTPWRNYFDLASLNEYVPSIELETYTREKGVAIDQMINLQRLEQAFNDRGEWIETVIEEPCRHNIRKDLFSPEDFSVKVMSCLTAQGRTSVLIPVLKKKAAKSKSFVIMGFELLLHDQFGSLDYWNARRSMVYAKELREVGNQFMKTQLKYDPGKGSGRSKPKGGGGDYLSVHLRTQDYQQSKPQLVPSLKGLAKQIRILKKEQKLKVVFLSSDADVADKKTLRKLVGGKLIWYEPDPNIIARLGDGGVAIVDQWIAAHSKYDWHYVLWAVKNNKFFVGTTESTFSFRIREDRQFMRFSVESTFNQLCGSENDETDPHSCPPPTKWLLVEDKNAKGVHHSEL